MYFNIIIQRSGFFSSFADTSSIGQLASSISPASDVAPTTPIKQLTQKLRGVILKLYTLYIILKCFLLLTTVTKM